MKTKLLEVRDRGTFIPVLATKMESADPAANYLLHRAGYAPCNTMVLLTTLVHNMTSYDPYGWSDGIRTIPIAHKYITDNFDSLQHGDVVDVEFILGERSTPKLSERFEPAL